MYFIGIDIGTSSISSVTYDYEKKKTESVTIFNDATLLSAAAWEKIQSPERILEIVDKILDDFLSRYVNIKGIGITGQMHGILYTDSEGEAVSPLYTWMDGRGNQLYRNNLTYADFLCQHTGYNLATGFGLVTHYYNQVNNLIPERARYICTIMDYVVMKLTGRKTPLTDYSNGASMGFFDLKNLRFDPIALKKTGIDLSFLPEVTGSASSCGYFRDDIPVYPAIGDNQAAFLGSVRDKQKSLHITIGTSSQISIYSEKYVDIPALDTRPFPGGGYLLVGAALCGGQAFAMLKAFFEKTLEKFVNGVLVKPDVYQLMNTVLYNDNSGDLPIVETLFNGTRSLPAKRGAITNISLDNFTPDNLIVGFLKGISHELYSFYECMPESLKDEKNEIVGSGNALLKNLLLGKILEEQFDIKLLLSGYQEEAAFGACLNAVTGSGFI